MATRPLTSKFVSLRTVALQKKDQERSFSRISDDDTAELITQQGKYVAIPMEPSIPPEWIDTVEQVKRDITDIKQRLKELNILHDKHVNKPDFDDSVEEEQEIEIRTQHITQTFRECQRSIKSIGDIANRSNAPQQVKMSKNIMSTLALELQSLSQDFKKGQNKYLARLKGREEIAPFKSTLKRNGENGSSSLALSEDELREVYDPGFSAMQREVLEDNSLLTRQREEEITKIVQSIAELSDIFKDLASMIYEQGTIIDRIDFNIDLAFQSIGKGEEELKKADHYHKKSRKTLCIIVLLLLVVALIFGLIFTK